MKSMSGPLSSVEVSLKQHTFVVITIKKTKNTSSNRLQCDESNIDFDDDQAIKCFWQN